jgi:hypothetical protein
MIFWRDTGARKVKTHGLSHVALSITDPDRSPS